MKSLLLVFFISAFMFSCSENSKEIKDKIEIILEEDLDFMCNELKDGETLDRPYYNILSYKEFENALLYNIKTEVEFYYIKGNKLKQLRKYRYDYNNRKWERYHKKMKFNLE